MRAHAREGTSSAAPIHVFSASKGPPPGAVLRNPQLGWGPMVRFHRGRVLKPRAKPPYGFLSVCTDGDRYLYVARGVALAFHGAPPSDDHEAAHQNGDVSNNRPGNLAGNQRPWPADKVERWSIDRLIPYAKNARTHTDAQVAAIAASIKAARELTPPVRESARS